MYICDVGGYRVNSDLRDFFLRKKGTHKEGSKERQRPAQRTTERETVMNEVEADVTQQR